MLTEKETRDTNFYGDRALDSVREMKAIIAYFENPVHDMTWGEFSKAMHRELDRYDDAADRVEAIYKAEFKRMFGDDEEDEDE